MTRSLRATRQTTSCSRRCKRLNGRSKFLPIRRFARISAILKAKWKITSQLRRRTARMASQALLKSSMVPSYPSSQRVARSITIARSKVTISTGCSRSLRVPAETPCSDSTTWRMISWWPCRRTTLLTLKSPVSHLHATMTSLRMASLRPNTKK